MVQEQGFKKLIGWQKADDLASAVFRAAQKLPPQHRWLASQSARAAVSVPANIAEGYGRGSQAEYLRFLDIARGSLAEVEYYIHFLARENLVDEATTNRLESVHSETGKVLHGLWRGLKAKVPATWDHAGVPPRIRELTFDSYEADV
jgi:four helix bundle protein